LTDWVADYPDLAEHPIGKAIQSCGEAIKEAEDAYLATTREDGTPRRWTDEQVFALNARQHDGGRHPYTCGNDSRHRPLIATRDGWRCADCDYTQDWSHETKETT